MGRISGKNTKFEKKKIKEKKIILNIEKLKLNMTKLRRSTKAITY